MFYDYLVITPCTTNLGVTNAQMIRELSAENIVVYVWSINLKTSHP